MILMDYFMSEDMLFPMLVLTTSIIGLASQLFVKHAYNKWAKIPMAIDQTGADVARRMLNANGANEVGITQVEGHLTDYYDPRDNQLHLSQDNYSKGSVASVAVACHEAGHAIQKSQGYLMLNVRASLVPIVNFALKTWGILFIAGILLDLIGLAQIAVALYGVAVLFHLVTLPVEIDASRRAVQYIDTLSMSPQERSGARAVLVAAALTYVASALISILNLLYYTGLARRR
jgi:Zn-dependent membrane protease YugP